MILLKQKQRTINVNIHNIKADIQKLLHILGYDDFNIGIWLTTNRTIRKYNNLYRKKDRPTDILSFPYHQNISAGKTIKPKRDEDKNLGDILISLEYAQKDAQRLNIPFEQHLRHLIVHGMCHLLGYDHHTETGYRKMRKKERSLLKQL